MIIGKRLWLADSLHHESVSPIWQQVGLDFLVLSEALVGTSMSPQNPSGFAVYALLIGAGLLGAGSDALLNQWAKTGRLAWLLAAYLAWLIVATMLGLILRWGYFGFGAAVVLFLLVNSLAALILDRTLFDGRLSWWGWIGVGLAIAAIVCIELGRNHSDGGPTPVPLAPGHIEKD